MTLMKLGTGRCRVAASAALMMVAVAACDGGSRAPSSNSASSIATSTSSPPSPPEPETPTTTPPNPSNAYVAKKPPYPVAARKQTRDGAVAFVKYYWATMIYAWAKPDATALPPLAMRSCSNCAIFEKAVDTFVENHQHFSEPPIEVLSADIVYLAEDEAQVITRIKRTKASLVDQSGKVVETNTEEEGTRAFRLKWEGRWLVNEFGKG